MRALVALIAAQLAGCQLLIDVGDTEQVGPSEITIHGDGLVDAVTVQLTANGVDETLVVTGDGDFTFTQPVTPTYSVALVGGPPCALGDNAAGAVDGQPITVELACISSTRLTALELDSLVAPVMVAVDDATTTYPVTLRELQPTTHINATPRSSRAVVTINGQAGSDIALPPGPQTITIVVDHPLSEVLRSTYIIEVARAQPVFANFGKAFPVTLDALGWSTSTDGARYATGAPNEDSATDPSNPNDNAATNSGAAYVFARSGEQWAFESFVKAPNADPNDGFGTAVALDGDRLVVGAPFEDSGSTNLSDNSAGDAGAAYVYRHEAGGWVFEQYLKSPRPQAAGFFGWSVAIAGDTIAIGGFNEAFQAGATALTASGQVHVFRRSGTTWTLEATLGPDETFGAGDALGYAVALHGDVIVAGAPSGNSTVGGAGAARIYRRAGARWTFEQQLVASDAKLNDFFGGAVALEGDTAVVTAAAVLHSVTSDQVSDRPGEVFVFERAGGSWTEVAKLSASNGDADDELGRSVAIAGGTIAASAFREDGSGKGLNPPSTNTASDAGAVYLFTRTAGAWTQSRYLKATNTDANDGFGTSLSMAANGVLVIGAAGESSANGDPASNGAQSSGACYVLH